MTLQQALDLPIIRKMFKSGKEKIIHIGQKVRKNDMRKPDLILKEFKML